MKFRLENPVFNGSDCAWGEDPDYYNDLPGKVPPEAQPPLPPLPDYHQNGVEVFKFTFKFFPSNPLTVPLLFTRTNSEILLFPIYFLSLVLIIWKFSLLCFADDYFDEFYTKF